jgi:peptide subunit release factor 1 (eRF1)
VIKVECPECGEQFETESNVLFLFNQIYCSACDAPLEVIEEEPLVLQVIDEKRDDFEDMEEVDDWTDE